MKHSWYVLLGPWRRCFGIFERSRLILSRCSTGALMSKWPEIEARRLSISEKQMRSIVLRRIIIVASASSGSERRVAGLTAACKSYRQIRHAGSWIESPSPWMGCLSSLPLADVRRSRTYVPRSQGSRPKHRARDHSLRLMTACALLGGLSQELALYWIFWMSAYSEP